jgi:hypothetical protein
VFHYVIIHPSQKTDCVHYIGHNALIFVSKTYKEKNNLSSAVLNGTLLTNKGIIPQTQQNMVIIIFVPEILIKKWLRKIHL